jgi:hypothetical protein
MSVNLVKWAIRQQLTATQKLVLIVLAEHGDKDGRCYPGQELLARETSLTERAVRKAIHVLRDVGLIGVQRRTFVKGGSTSNYYTFNIDVDVETIPQEGVDEVESGQEPRSSPVESGQEPCSSSGQEPCSSPYKEEPPVLTTRSAHERVRDASVIFDTERNAFQVAPEVLDGWVERYRRLVDPDHWSPDMAEEWVRHQVRSAAVYLSNPANRKKYRDLKRFLENQLSRAGERLIVPHARYPQRQHRATA